MKREKKQFLVEGRDHRGEVRVRKIWAYAVQHAYMLALYEFGYSMKEDMYIDLAK